MLEILITATSPQAPPGFRPVNIRNMKQNMPRAWRAGRRILPLAPGAADPLPAGTIIATFRLPEDYLWGPFYAVYLGRTAGGVLISGPWEDICHIITTADAMETCEIGWGHDHAAYDAGQYSEALAGF